MASDTEYVQNATSRTVDVIDEYGLSIRELDFLNGRPVRLEVYKPSEEPSYLAVSGEAAPLVELEDFFVAVEGAFEKADEQNVPIGDITVIIWSTSQDDGPLLFGYDRSEGIATIDSLKEEGLDVSSISLIRFDSHQVGAFTFEPWERRAGVIFHQGNSADHPAYGYMLEMFEPKRKRAAEHLGRRVLQITNQPPTTHLPTSR